VLRRMGGIACQYVHLNAVTMLMDVLQYCLLDIDFKSAPCQESLGGCCSLTLFFPLTRSSQNASPALMCAQPYTQSFIQNHRASSVPRATHAHEPGRDFDGI